MDTLEVRDTPLTLEYDLSYTIGILAYKKHRKGP